MVLGHCWIGLEGAGLIPDERLFGAVENAIYLFHMPVFFFVSGLFFKAVAAPGAFLRGRAESLLWPLVLWSWVEALALMAAGEGRAPVDLIGLLTYPAPPKIVFWFLWALFVLQVVTYALHRLFRARTEPVLIVLALAALGYFAMGFDPGGLVNVLENAPYFLAGVILASRRAELLDGRFPLGLAVLLLVGTEGLVWIWGAVPVPPAGQLLALAAVLGFTVLVGRTAGMRPGAALAWLGQRTMPVYLTHIIVLAVVRVVLLKLGQEGLALHLLLGVGCGIGLPVLLDQVVQRLGLSRLAGFGSRRAT